LNRGAWVGASSGLISYEGFKVQVAAAARDPNTKAILLDLESPGGEAIGAFEAAAAVREAAKSKTVVAVANGMAASAAYAIASAASRVVVPPTGMVGSIGVVMMHLDFSKYLEGEGVKPTLIFAGAHKVDGNPYEPLPESVRAEWQQEVDSFYQQFVATVAAGRRGLSDQGIRSTEARMFKGDAAVAAGLADSVGTFEEVLADLSRGNSGRSPSTIIRGKTMDSNPGVSAATIADNPTLSAAMAQIATSAQLAAAYPALAADLRAEGATAERERLAGIDRISAGVDASVIAEMKADPSVTPEKAAFRILEASQAKRSTVMASIQAVEDVTKAVTASATTAGGSEPPKQSAHELAAKARTYQDEQARAGNRISTAQAVAHVERNG
jgi:signal peptide peptidase SppA